MELLHCTLQSEWFSDESCFKGESIVKLVLEAGRECFVKCTGKQELDDRI